MHDSYKKWLNDGKPKTFCKCGCNTTIIIINNHKYCGIPKYIKGHNSYGKNNSMFGRKTFHSLYINWLKNNKPKIICSCGCNQEIIIKEYHKYYSIPKYISGHNSKGHIPSEKTRQKISEMNKREKAYNWQGGKSFEPYCPKFNKQKREETREKYGRTCYLCGKIESDQLKEMKEKGKQPHRLSVHHLDSDKGQGCNGKPWKLVPLCIHCHGMM